ncbi:PTS sugar transporter subunit IIA [Nissabacter sp. SGAir0207]|uniref:PTS sugar transporter subunit IIA n=1 Tax=Nissabacter sp. SGAir0207 TaxID=2126321 RepID=UPI0010CD03DA|nr:PTS sugar transporter subunit IIA [Nissabacter sp. SGAir0207]QCR38111.1 PTS fructose transporter subunit IIA [Nissabacter sp. SGAir0207]
MALNNTLEPGLIWLNPTAADRNALFGQISEALLAKGIVEPSYPQALLLREQNHPTAMQLERLGVAIPHVDVEHVREERLAVVTCPEGMVFNQAEDPDLTMKVHVIFFLLLKEKDAHLEFLMKLIALFQQSDDMEKILHAASPEEVIQVLAAHLD